MYLLGFLQGNKWYVFSDARLKGSGHDQAEHLHEWTKIGFRGNHTDDRLGNVEIGVSGLIGTIKTLLNHERRKLQEVKTALYHVIVTVSKAKRFPEWLRDLLKIFTTGNPHPVGVDFANLFMKWSKMSKRVLDGPNMFTPLLNYETYTAVVSAVAVLLQKKRKKEKAVESEFRNPVAQYDPDYDIIQSDSEEEEETEEEKSEEEESEEEFFDVVYEDDKHWK